MSKIQNLHLLVKKIVKIYLILVIKKSNKGNIVIGDFSLAIYLNPNDYALQSNEIFNQSINDGILMVSFKLQEKRDKKKLQIKKVNKIFILSKLVLLNKI